MVVSPRRRRWLHNRRRVVCTRRRLSCCKFRPLVCSLARWSLEKTRETSASSPASSPMSHYCKRASSCRHTRRRRAVKRGGGADEQTHAKMAGLDPTDERARLTDQPASQSAGRLHQQVTRVASIVCTRQAASSIRATAATAPPKNSKHAWTPHTPRVAHMPRHECRSPRRRLNTRRQRRRLFELCNYRARHYSRRAPRGASTVARLRVFSLGHRRVGYRHVGHRRIEVAVVEHPSTRRKTSSMDSSSALV